MTSEFSMETLLGEDYSGNVRGGVISTDPALTTAS
jgi:hypothetical protein